MKYQRREDEQAETAMARALFAIANELANKNIIEVQRLIHFNKPNEAEDFYLSVKEIIDEVPTRVRE